jgi:hypothetical protein
MYMSGLISPASCLDTVIEKIAVTYIAFTSNFWVNHAEMVGELSSQQ